LADYVTEVMKAHPAYAHRALVRPSAPRRPALREAARTCAEPIAAWMKCVLLAIFLGAIVFGARWTYQRVAEVPQADVQLADSARTGRAQDVRTALARGAGVNLQDLNGFTPLMWAAGGDDAECVQLLLDHGADVRRMAANGTTPLTMAAQSGRVDAVKRLLDAGADPNQQAPGGPTALFVAAAAGHEDVIEVLLARRARVNTRSIDGRTPLLAAAAQASTTPEGLRRLLTAGADANLADYAGVTPHLEAMNAGRDDLAALLVSPAAAHARARLVHRQNG